MSLTKTTYRAVRADVEADGKHVRILRDVEGPHSDLRGDMPKHVARLREEQARDLRDSLNEVLEGL
jgi:hypothetical protein